MTPSSGPSAGGSTVKIVGMNFSGATAVKFGAALATGVVANGAGTMIISGTPTAAGTFTFTVQVTDAEQPSASAIKALSISVS